MNENRILIPIAVLVAAVIIVGAVFFSNRKNAVSVDPVPIDGLKAEDLAEEFSIRAVSGEDHLLGNPDADIIIVEYSDLECPFCARHHPTIERIMEEYGKDGRVAWVYRHFPLDQAHKRARPAAEASECVANLSDNPVAFWEFISGVLRNQPASLTEGALRNLATDLGVDEEQYNKCVIDGTYAKDVQDDSEDGQLIGEVDPDFGTPYNILVRKDGLQVPLNGAQPYEVFKQIIDMLLAEQI